MAKDLDEHFKRILALLERMAAAPAAEIHVHVHTADPQGAKTIADAVRDAESPRPFSG